MSYVSVPDDNSDIDKDQFLYLVEHLERRLRIARYRYEHSFEDRSREREVLDDDESAYLNRACAALTKLRERHEMPPLVKLACEAPSTEAADHSPKVDKVLKDMVLHQFIVDSDRTEILRLALALLVDADLEGAIPTLLAVLSGDLETSRSGGWGWNRQQDRPVHACPRCMGEGSLTLPLEEGKRWHKSVKCNRCNELGYLLQEEAPADEEDSLSLKGRLAVNAGQEWTDEQEAAAQDYDSVEEFRESWGSVAEILGRSG